MRNCRFLCLALLTYTLIAVTQAWGAPPPSAPLQPAPSPRSALIAGQALLPDHSPLQNGVVLLYDRAKGPPPHPQRYWRIPDMITGLGPDGAFSLQVPGGTYYLMIAQKNPDDAIGPPNKNEWLYFHAAAPDTARPIEAANGKTVELGPLIASLWSPAPAERQAKRTAIEGTVTDLEGAPVGKVVVFAYLSRNAVGRPLFVSDPTDPQGRFQLRLYGGGTYYLRVRSVMGGGTPQVGEYLNTTDEFVPTEVRVEQEQIRQGVQIKVKRFSRPEEATGKELRNMQKLERPQ